MVEGLLWLDNDAKADVRDRIGRAFERYREKHGRPPALCLVNPLDLGGLGGDEGPFELSVGAGALRILPTNRVPRSHFLVGVPR